MIQENPKVPSMSTGVTGENAYQVSESDRHFRRAQLVGKSFQDSLRDRATLPLSRIGLGRLTGSPEGSSFRYTLSVSTVANHAQISLLRHTACGSAR